MAKVNPLKYFNDQAAQRNMNTQNTFMLGGPTDPEKKKKVYGKKVGDTIKSTSGETKIVTNTRKKQRKVRAKF